MPEDNNETPFRPLEPYDAPPASVAPIDSPENIVRDLIETEKEIAAESLRLIRTRYDHEKAKWESLFAEKEKELLSCRSRLSESEDRLKQLQKQFQEERQVQLEQLKESARDLEIRRKADEKKWESIAERVKVFRETADNAQNKLIAEQERIARLRRSFVSQEQAWKEKLQEKDEALFQFKENLLKKEQSWLQEQSRREEEIHLLQEQVNALQQTINDERQYQGKNSEKKDGDISKLQKALQDTIIQLNAARRRAEQAEEKTAEQHKLIQNLENEQQKFQQRLDQERLEWKKAQQEEQSGWEEYRRETVAREENLQRETEEQTKRILQSSAIIEQQLSEEQKLRQESDAKILQKDHEIQRLLKQRDELVAEWQNVLATEQTAWQKQQAEIRSEFERAERLREEELIRLKQDIHSLGSAVAEEKKLILREKEQNQELVERIRRQEEEKQVLCERLEAREKEWQGILLREQELARTQIEELSFNTSAQLHSRETEITRLNEDLKILNGQFADLRQKFAMETNENTNRLERIQELEARMKTAAEKHAQDRAEWQKNIQAAQEVWEKQHQNLVLYHAGIEQQYQRDISVYQNKHKDVSERLRQLQETLETAQAEILRLEGERAGFREQIERQKQEEIDQLQKKIQGLQYGREQDRRELRKAEEEIQKLEAERVFTANRTRAEKDACDRELQQLKQELASLQERRQNPDSENS